MNTEFRSICTEATTKIRVTLSLLLFNIVLEVLSLIRKDTLITTLEINILTRNNK